nr:MAG TPA: hypothetical protein [Caudoviricetes sp.]
MLFIYKPTSHIQKIASRDGGKVLHQRTAVFIQQTRKGIFTLFMQGKNRAILQ